MLFQLNKIKEGDLDPANDLLSGDNLLNQIVNISKAAAYDVVAAQVKELQAENKALREDNKRLTDSHANVTALALEFGYKQCEKGENIQAAFLNYNKVINP